MEIQSDITCLVGKNVSGKTAFLHALYRLRPGRPDAKFFSPEQYPAWTEKRDRMKGVNIEQHRPIRAVFKLEPDDLQDVEKRFGADVISGDTLTLQKNYKNETTYILSRNEKSAVNNLVSGLSFPTSVADRVQRAESFDALKKLIADLRADKEDESTSAATTIENRYNEVLGNETFVDAVWKLIEPKIPKFFTIRITGTCRIP